VVKNQLEIIRLRNTSKAFSGQAIINERAENLIDILWQKNNHTAHLKANLQTFAFTIDYSEDGILKTLSYS
jgi:sucrose phosphorylase